MKKKKTPPNKTILLCLVRKECAWLRYVASWQHEDMCLKQRCVYILLIHLHMYINRHIYIYIVVMLWGPEPTTPTSEGRGWGREGEGTGGRRKRGTASSSPLPPVVCFWVLGVRAAPSRPTPISHQNRPISQNKQTDEKEEEWEKKKWEGRTIPSLPEGMDGRGLWSV